MDFVNKVAIKYKKNGFVFLFLPSNNHFGNDCIN